MTEIDLAGLWIRLVNVCRLFYEMAVHLLLMPNSAFSITSLLSALCIAVLFLGWRRPASRRNIKPRVLIRALFPRKLMRSRSSKADVGFFLLNTFIMGLTLGWAILSYHVVSKVVNGGLISTFGALEPSTLSAFWTGLILTVAMFLAYEFGYWLDHYLSHVVPFLWEFHKVHHTAEVLSPLTNFRVHPVDTLVFVNLLALVMGATEGSINYLFGKTIEQFTISHSNVILVVFTYLVDHLHHTQFWIAFTGWWGRIFLSPAHHQIHHSIEPRHFNKNMGSCLALFDWLFGTLHMPSRKKEKLTFGVAPLHEDAHSVTGSLVVPVVLGWGHVKALLLRLMPRLGRPDASPLPR